MRYKNILIFFILGIMTSCGYNTKMTGTWREYPDKSVSYNNIAVLALTKNLEARKLIEDLVDQKLNNYGINAMAGLLFLPPNATKDNISPDVVKELLTLNGFDAVMTISVLGKEDTRRYVPGSYLYSPINNASFYDYYGQMSNYLYAPGYYTGSVYVFLETNLFEYPGGKMIWSGQSETSNITDLRKSADIFSDIIVKELLKNKVIEP